MGILFEFYGIRVRFPHGKTTDHFEGFLHSRASRKLAKNKDAGVMQAAGEVKIGPLNILRLKEDEAVALIREAVASSHKLDIGICNAHTILTALDDPQYAATLQAMTLFNDGIGADIASKVLCGSAFPDNLNGTDFLPVLLERVDRPLRIYLLGAHEVHVSQAKAHLEKTFPQHEVVGYRNGYFIHDEIPVICDIINAAKPDLLLVAMGNPYQEQFIVENRNRLDATVAIGVGALFDFMSGAVVRAPKFVQHIGMEWLFRLLQEPHRLAHRYLIGIPRFFFALYRLRMQAKKAS